MVLSNKLAGETSPYLLQHAGNPVHWLPWGEEALALARSEDRPILLSVGYSACHWCHVMAHECFEDTAIAARMNELFVNVKVDREERPDIDRIYQLAHQILTRRAGGWPLTVFLTPDDHLPFYAGTYFPPQPSHGMPSFPQVLEALARYYRERRSEIDSQRGAILDALASTEPEGDDGDAPTPAPLRAAREELERVFDERHGGFGSAPKFPHPSNLNRLLRYHAAAAGEADETALSMVVTTLRRMAHGGIYDHLGGGFFRYSVDGEWMIPHFEKMLYDNGPLLELYARAWQLTGEELFARTARETAAWLTGQMQAAEGGFYSSLDADSEGEEGRYYVWQPEQVRALLDDTQYACFSRNFGLDGEPNFEGVAWHLHGAVDEARIAAELGLDPAQVRRHLDAARGIVLRERAARVPPGLDDKILTAWNALTIRGLCSAGQILAQPELVAAAGHAMDYLRTTMFRDGRLLATARDGRAHLDAYLDDHALLLDACLALLQCRWRRVDLDFACTLAELLLRHFEDEERGGFFFTAHDHERLLHRPRPMMDDALPSGNAVASLALGRLGHLLGDTRYLEAAERTVRAATDGLQRYPHAHTAMLDALEELLTPPQTVILRGDPETLQAWLAVVNEGYRPRRLALAIPVEAPDLPGLLAARDARGGTTAYVCQGHHCEAPITDLAALRAALG
jgi:uncharacterized protein YyaL (SSP411 family)